MTIGDYCVGFSVANFDNGEQFDCQTSDYCLTVKADRLGFQILQLHKAYGFDSKVDIMVLLFQ